MKRKKIYKYIYGKAGFYTGWSVTSDEDYLKFYKQYNLPVAFDENDNAYNVYLDLAKKRGGFYSCKKGYLSDCNEKVKNSNTQKIEATEEETEYYYKLVDKFKLYEKGYKLMER